jgi:cytolysin (calcineurin-like family phosphatase)
VTTTTRTDAAIRIAVAVLATLACYVWPAVGAAVAVGLTAAGGLGRRV